MPNEQELIALNDLKNECNQIRANAFSSMRDYLRMPEHELKNTGYKLREQAVVASYKHAQEKIEKLEKEFFKKFPD